MCVFAFQYTLAPAALAPTDVPLGGGRVVLNLRGYVAAGGERYCQALFDGQGAETFWLGNTSYIVNVTAPPVNRSLLTQIQLACAGVSGRIGLGAYLRYVGDHRVFFNGDSFCGYLQLCLLNLTIVNPPPALYGAQSLSVLLVENRTSAAVQGSGATGLQIQVGSVELGFAVFDSKVAQ